MERSVHAFHARRETLATCGRVKDTLFIHQKVNPIIVLMIRGLTRKEIATSHGET